MFLMIKDKLLRIIFDHYVFSRSQFKRLNQPLSETKKNSSAVYSHKKNLYRHVTYILGIVGAKGRTGKIQSGPIFLNN